MEARQRERQEKILNFIKASIDKNKYSPTIREIMEGVNIKSSSIVHEQLKAMRKNGVINFVDATPRTISIVN